MFAALGIALIINCSGGGKDAPTAPTAPVAPVVVGSVTVGGTPAEGALLVGGSVTLTATAVSTTGSTVSGRTTTWSSSDPSVATVAAGAVVGVASGPVTISASVDGVVGRTTLSVRVPISTPPAGASTPTVAAVLSGAVTLTIPPTAVPTGTALSVAPAALPSDNRAVPATTYVFGPDGTTFSSPLTLALRYDKAAVATADQSTLWLASVDASGVATPIAGSAVDLTTGVVSAPVSHFSSYTIIKPAAPASIAVVSGDAQSATVGTAPSTAISVRVLDASSRPVPGAAVRFAVASGNGTLSGATTATTNYLGVATLAGTWVLGTASGAQTLTATPSTGSATAATITATGIASAATKLVLSGTGTQVAGATQTVTVTAKDANGNTATTYTGAKSLTFSGAATAPGGQKPTAGGTAFGTATSVTFTNGVATLPLVLNTTETAKLSVTDGTLSAATTDQLSVTVTAGAATQLGLVRSIVGATSGTAFVTQPIVALKDANGNTVFTDNSTVITMAVSAGGTLSGATTATTSAGMATWRNATLSGAPGSYTVTFSAGALATASQSVTLVSGDPTQLVLTTIAAGATSGAAFATQPVVAVQDASGNTVTSATPLVTMTASAGATLVGTTTASAVNGVVTFKNIGVSGAAGTSYTLTAAATGLASATQSIMPTAGTANQLVLTTSAAGAASGVAFTTQPVVAIRDSAGNTVTTATHSITMTVSTGATLVGIATVSAVNGVATFSTVGIAGIAGTNYTLTFAASGLPAVTQAIAPTVGPATRLTLTRAPLSCPYGASAADCVSPDARVAQGFAAPPQVTILDAGGNTVTSATTVVTMSLGSGATVVARSGGTISDVGTATATAVNGVATFDQSLSLSGTAGTYVLTFSSLGLSPATYSIKVLPGDLYKTSVTRTPESPAKSGAAFAIQPQVTLQDFAGNTYANICPYCVGSGNTGYDVIMVVDAPSSLDRQPQLVGTWAIPLVEGQSVYNFTGVGFSGAVGTQYRLRFGLSHSGSGVVCCASSSSTGLPILLTAGTASQLVLSTRAEGAANGAAFTTPPVVTIQDRDGNLVTTANTAVTMTVSAGATVVGNASATAVNGVAKFTGAGITGTVATNYTLTFVQPGLTAATQSISLYSQATQLAVVTSAAGAENGAAFTTQPVVKIQDARGNTVPTGSAVVTITVSAGATVVGTATATTVNGVASFVNVGISATSPNMYTLTFSSSGLAVVTQSIPFAPSGPFYAQSVQANRNWFTSCALTSAGAAYCWGENNMGMYLGDGTTVGHRTPMPVLGSSGGPSLVLSALRIGSSSQCGLDLSGAAYCWGLNCLVSCGYEQLLGVSTTDPVLLTPAPVVGVAGGPSLTFRALDVGPRFACGLSMAGAAYCWGQNTNGRLGDGTSVDRFTPTAVPGVNGGAPLVYTAISTGYRHACGLTATGAAICWGETDLLGTGSASVVRSLPTPVLGVGGGAPLAFTSISASQTHTCGLTSSGAAYCWGINQVGALGNSTTISSYTPVAVLGVDGGVPLTFASISSGSYMTCGLTASGTAYCWGQNSYGQLGDNTTTDRYTPVPVLGVGGGAPLTFAQISAGAGHSCGVVTGGRVYCWGQNTNGELGDNTTGNHLTPAAVIRP